MILFLYGADNYRLNRKIKQLKEKFISASLGDTNLAILDGTTISYSELARQVLALPFLSKSRLVIVNQLFGAKKDVIDKIVDFLPKVPQATVLVIAQEGNPDRRTKLFKTLNKPKISQEFKPLEGEYLRRWIRKEFELRSSNYEVGTIEKLIEYVGSDLWRMANEIEKLTTYNKQLTTRDIDLLVQPQIQSNIFDLMDFVAQKNARGALKELNRLIGEGKAEPYILSMIVMEYRNLLIIKDLTDRAGGNANSYALAKQAGLHPFVVQKTLALTRNYALGDLKKVYRTLLDFDTKIKTGRMESRVALELLIFKLTNSKVESGR